MATVFYWTATGKIYGVHPTGLVVKGGVPEGVEGLEVAAPPAGCERTHVVDIAATPPTLVPDPELDARNDADSDHALNKAVLAMGIALGTHPSMGLTIPQIRTRFRAAFKALP